ncbi:MAG: ROK family transcriptional regulator [Bacteroidota bacterium]
MLTGTNLTFTKDYNLRIVFETIRLEGPISRADIARKTNLTAQTASNIATRLLEKGLVVEGTKRQNGRGAPSITLEVNPDGAHSIGLDFNSDHLTGILVNLTGEVTGKVYYEVNTPNPEESIDLMAITIEELCRMKNGGIKNLLGVGIGFPGPMTIGDNETVTNVVNPKAFPNWKQVPVVELLKKHIDVPIFLENNASAAALGERWYGVGQSIPTFQYVFFGAGLGGGLIINGEIVDGAHANTGEIGYLPLGECESPLCNSDSPHIGEHFNLSSLYTWLGEHGVSKVKRPQDLEALLVNQEPFFMDWLNTGVKILAPAILAIEYLIDPQAIILGGRLPLSILGEIREGLHSEVNTLRIVENAGSPQLLSSTAGIDAVSLGAATLPMFELLAAQSAILNKR